MCTGFVGFRLTSRSSCRTVAATINLKGRTCLPPKHTAPDFAMKAPDCRPLLIVLPFVLLALGGSVANAQMINNYGDAPAAEAAGAADAANRAANGAAMKAGADDMQLMGGPAAYGEVYQTQTNPGGPQQRLPAAGGNGQAATSFEHMLNNPGAPQAGNANLKPGAPANAANGMRNNAAGAQATGAANAALQLYGDGTATAAPRHEIYKSPW
jgi:hypothetical protein